MLVLAVVRLGSGSSGHFCPICGSELVVIEYLGHESDKLALMKSERFCCFLGCIRVDLHDKIVDGVNHRGKVYVLPMFHEHGVRRGKRVS